MCVTKLTVWPAHFSDASAAYASSSTQLSRDLFDDHSQTTLQLGLLGRIVCVVQWRPTATDVAIASAIEKYLVR